MASLRRTLTLGAMASAENAMKNRYERGNLEVGVAYVQVNKTGRTKVGKFLHSARYGSGDGMELVLVFELNGKTNQVREDMWGSVSGAELSHFEKDE